MSTAAIRATLVAGGVSEEELNAPPSSDVAAFCPIIDPGGAEYLIGHLCEKLKRFEPTRVVVRSDDGIDYTIGFVAARYLQVGAAAINETQGLLEFEGVVHDADRIVILSDAFRTEMPLSASVRMVEGAGAQVVAIGALVRTPVLTEIGNTYATVNAWPPASGEETQDG